MAKNITKLVNGIKLPLTKLSAKRLSELKELMKFDENIESSLEISGTSKELKLITNGKK